MTTLMQQASRLALIATLSATPVVLAAQTATDSDTTVQTTPEATADQSTDSTSDMATSSDSTTMPADDSASETAETETENTDQVTSDETAPMTDSATADAPAATTDPAMTDSDTAEAPAMDTTDTDTAAVEEEVKPVEGQIVMQGENTILAEQLIGSNVYSTNGESIGEIDDLIVNLDGSVEGAIIGVGGFLGIGEKWVAVEMASFTTQQDDMGNVRLVTSSTKADLEAAEAFVTADDQVAANAAADPAAGTGTVAPTE